MFDLGGGIGAIVNKNPVRMSLGGLASGWYSGLVSLQVPVSSHPRLCRRACKGCGIAAECRRCAHALSNASSPLQNFRARRVRIVPPSVPSSEQLGIGNVGIGNDAARVDRSGSGWPHAARNRRGGLMLRALRAQPGSLALQLRTYGTVQTPLNLRPSVQNGYIGTVAWADTMYVSGIFEGDGPGSNTQPVNSASARDASRLRSARVCGAGSRRGGRWATACRWDLKTYPAAPHH